MLIRFEALLELLEAGPLPRAAAVLTTCTKQKVEHSAPAEELYLGLHHTRLMAGVRHYRNHGGRCDVCIVSAGLGVLHGSNVVAPYEATFLGMCRKRREETVARLCIPEAAAAFLRLERDLKIIALSTPYYRACAFDFARAVPGKIAVICAESVADELRRHPREDLYIVPVGNRDAIRHHCGSVALKGHLAGRLLYELAGEKALRDREPWRSRGASEAADSV